MSIFDKFEKAVDDALKKLGRGGRRREPLEISRAVVADAESRIVPLGGGRRVFPFRRVTVRLLAPDVETRALYEVAFVNDRTLAKALAEHLRPPRCEQPAGLNVSVEVVEDPQVEWAAEGFHVVYEGGGARQAEAAPAPAAGAGAQLVVMKGEAQPPKCKLTKRRTNVGRSREVLDREGRPFRRNDLAFDEGGSEVNQTVSQMHAHINYDAGTGEYRLYDDNSANGTVILRADGRRVNVTRGLGAALLPGDEIYFGQARVVFRNER